jgi:RimK family alpha-L-glutamate ligase
MKKVLILTDKKGWHFQQLKQSLIKNDIPVESINISKLIIATDSKNTKILREDDSEVNVSDVIVRYIPGGSLEEIVTYLNILRVFKNQGVNVINTAESIETTVDKSLTSIILKNNNILTPKTWIIRGKNKSIEFAQELLKKHVLIYKPLFGSQGDNIKKINKPSDIKNINNPSNVYYLQEFISIEPNHDYRVLIIKNKNKKFSYSMARYGNSFVNNFSKGGKCVSIPFNKEIINTAFKSAEALNIPFCGVDLIKKDNLVYVIEANSIPAWKGIQTTTNDIVSDKIVEIFIKAKDIKKNFVVKNKFKC